MKVAKLTCEQKLIQANSEVQKQSRECI